MTERMRVPKDEEPRMTRYYAEEPCEHGSMESHFTHTATHRLNGGLSSDTVTISQGPMCPGGSRRRVRIDYEAAGRALAAEVSKVRTEGNRKFLGVNVRTVVDAALVTEEPPK